MEILCKKYNIIIMKPSIRLTAMVTMVLKLAAKETDRVEEALRTLRCRLVGGIGYNCCYCCGNRDNVLALSLSSSALLVVVLVIFAVDQTVFPTASTILANPSSYHIHHALSTVQILSSRLPPNTTLRGVCILLHLL